MCIDKNPFKKNMDSHLYRDVHDKNLCTKKWIVIRTKMCMTKTHIRIIWIVIRTKMCMTETHKNMHSHSYRNMHDKNPYKKNMDSHSWSYPRKEKNNKPPTGEN